MEKEEKEYSKQKEEQMQRFHWGSKPGMFQGQQGGSGPGM